MSIKQRIFRVWLTSKVILYCLLLPDVVHGQIMIDGTTPTPNPGSCETLCTISGGSTDLTGINLFHSFRNFSLPTNGAVVFEHEPAVRNIFARVTGESRSEIDGVLRTNGANDTNLYFLNPNGIVFGPNGSLDISGSFVATTADAIQFGEQGIFDATGSNNNQSILTINPTAFLFNQTTAQPIINQSTAPNPLIPFIPGGLSVQDGKSLVLLGGNLTLESTENSVFGGGILTAPSGQIELGAIQGKEIVDLVINDNNLSLSYDPNTSFADISLDNGTLNISSLIGDKAGSVTINANNLSLSNNTSITSDTFSQENSGDVFIRANNSVSLSNSSITSLTAGPGDGGRIVLTANLLSLEGNSGLNVLTFGSGNAGSIDVQVQTLSLNNASQITAARAGFAADTGDAGNIQVQTNKLVLNNSSTIATSTFGEAFDTQTTSAIEIDVTGLISLARASRINSATFGEKNASDIRINAEEIVLQDSAEISASSDNNITANIATGLGGTINITADRLTADSRASVSARSTGTGTAGDVILQIDERLTLQGGAQFSVSGEGSGNSGTLNVNSGLVVLNDGQLLASVQEGEDGNIVLDIDNALVLRGESLISAEAFNNANGGNVDINAPFIIALFPDGPNGSDILASADAGNGGRISIETNNLFNIATNQAIDGNMTNDLDATSGTGIDGEVIITSPEVNPEEGTTRLPNNLAEPDISQGCQATSSASSGQFTNSGRGGLIPTPYDTLSNSGIQEDILPPGQTIAQSVSPTETTNILNEAIGWHKNHQGDVVLVPEDTTYQSACQHSFTGGAS